MRYLKLTIAYDGRGFVGWQVQPNGKTIQGELESAWRAFTGETLRITGSGRTDSGVHALGQVASLKTESTMPAKAIRLALNAHLPATIVVRDVQEAAEGFNAISDAIGKTYRYWIQIGRVRHPFLIDRCWFVPRHLDISAMQAAAVHLQGERDFASMQTTGAPRRSTIRHVTGLQVDTQSLDGFPMVEIQISANGFLYNMVRNIAGTLVDVGRGRTTPESIPGILAAKDRSVAGPTAPAAGLTMISVDYPDASTLSPPAD